MVSSYDLLVPRMRDTSVTRLTRRPGWGAAGDTGPRGPETNAFSLIRTSALAPHAIADFLGPILPGTRDGRLSQAHRGRARDHFRFRIAGVSRLPSFEVIFRLARGFKRSGLDPGWSVV